MCPIVGPLVFWPSRPQLDAVIVALVLVSVNSRPVVGVVGTSLLCGHSPPAGTHIPEPYITSRHSLLAGDRRHPTPIGLRV